MKHTIAFSLGIALLGTTLGTAHAQRAPIDRADRRAQRQQMLQGMTPEQRAQYFQNQRQQRLNAATPEQRARMEAARANGGNNGNGAAQNGGGGQGGRGGRNRNRGGAGNAAATLSPASREAQMRALMTSAGITDKAQQDPVITFVFAQMKAREPLLATAREVATTLRDTKSTPEQVSAKWTTYQSALDADKARSEKDLADLDQKIGWSKDARLQSFLSLVGVLGPESFVIGGAGAIFTPTPQARPVAATTAQTATAAPAVKTN